MTKGKVIRKLNELAKKHGEDTPVMLLLDICKHRLLWLQEKTHTLDDVLYKVITIKDLIDGTSTKDWVPSDLRHTIKDLEKGKFSPEKQWVRPEESEKELNEFEEANKELVEKKTKDLEELIKKYYSIAK